MSTQNTGDGAWLLRTSHKKFVISVRFQGKTWHLIIEQTPEGQYFIGQIAFHRCVMLFLLDFFLCCTQALLSVDKSCRKSEKATFAMIRYNIQCILS
jgi:hypothetical protein